MSLHSRPSHLLDPGSLGRMMGLFHPFQPKEGYGSLGASACSALIKQFHWQRRRGVSMRRMLLGVAFVIGVAGICNAQTPLEGAWLVERLESSGREYGHRGTRFVRVHGDPLQHHVRPRHRTRELSTLVTTSLTPKNWPLMTHSSRMPVGMR